MKFSLTDELETFKHQTITMDLINYFAVKAVTE